MTSPVPVTVALACHSGERWEAICAAIESIFAQDRPAQLVVAAVDHNPPLAARLRARFDGLSVVEQNSGQRGASPTRNAAASVARTPLIAFMDDDEVADPGWLAHLIAPFADESVVGTGGLYRPLWEQPRPRWFPDEFGWVVGAHYTGMPVSISRVRNVWAGSMAIRAAVFQAIGGFRTDFGKVGAVSRPEDTDLCIRAAAATNGHWLYVPQAIVDHQVPASRSTLRFFARRCFAEGRGKIEMRDALDDTEPDSLRHEAAYLRRTVPRGFFRNVLQGRGDRAAAMALGVGCALAGAISATATRLDG